MESSTKNVAKSARDVAYYQQRFRNRVFAKLVAWISEQAQSHQLTKKDIAERLNKDPAQITRLLSQPSNLTLDTIAELVLAFDAEPDPPDIVLFKDRAKPNYVHPLIARTSNISPGVPASKSDAQTESTSERKRVISTPSVKRNDVKIESMATA